MKAIAFFFVTALMLQGVQAQNCDTTHDACKHLSMSLDAANASQCNECASKCLSAKQACAAEKKTEKLRAASGLYLNCKNSCPVVSLSKKKA